MSSVLPGYEYDIFISYRQKDNKHDGWVTEFVDQLKGELEGTFKEDISVYFDINPHDGLLETHDVDASLKSKLKCLVFIPIISRTYCDPNSYAWEHEFKAFIEQASQDRFGLKTKLPNGNVTSRVLPVRIHDLEPDDIKLAENYLGFIRPVDFIFKSAGVNRPLRANEDHPQDNLNKIYYRDQINKVANAIDEIIHSLKKTTTIPAGKKGLADEPATGITKGELGKEPFGRVKFRQIPKKWLIALLSLILCLAAAFAIFKIVDSKKQSLSPNEKTIAVLRFKNLSNDTTKLYFCDGFMEEIRNNLSKIKDFTVRSGISSNQYRDTKKTSQTIGKELNADYLIGGSIGFEGNTRKILVHLIESGTDRQIWSDDYTREMEIEQMFSLQSNIARTVASELKAKLSTEELEKIEKRPTENLEAYKYYLQGNYYAKRTATQNFKTAIGFYERAIGQDPGFSLAYANGAMCLMQQYWFDEDRSEDLLHRCKQLIDKAFEIDPDLPEAHLALGIYFYCGFLKYEQALEEFNIVINDQPRNSEAIYWSACVNRRDGNWELAKSDFSKAFELNPRYLDYAFSIGETYFLLQDYSNAEKYFNIAIMLQPDWETPYPFLSGIFLRRDGDTRGAREVLENAIRNNKSLSTGPESFISAFIQIDLCEGNYKKAIQDLSLYKSDVFKSQFTFKPKNLYYAAIYSYMNKPELEHAYYDSTRQFLEKQLIGMPGDFRIYSSLGIAYAGLGLADKAVNAGKKAVDLMPVSKEAWKGTYPVADLARIYVMVGKYSEAMDQIKFLLSIPGELAPKLFQMDPAWAPLKDLPEFKKLLKTYSDN